MNIELGNILDNLFGGVYYVDKERKIKYWNQEAEEITGYTKDEVIGNYCYDNILQHVNEEGLNLCMNGCPLEKTINDGQKREAEVFLHHKDGHRVPVVIRAVPIRDNNDKIMGAVELFLENKKRKSLEEKLVKLRKENYQDELTNISNRKYLESILNEFLSNKNIKKQKIAFCFLDIDDFKYINDNYGHLIGDKVLKMTAKTLEKNIRPADKVFRWGGDEFALILFDIENNQQLSKILSRIRSLLNNSFINHNEETINITMSIGSTIIKADDNIESLTKRADRNMYESKKQGKDSITIS